MTETAFTPGPWQIIESKGFNKEVWRSIKGVISVDSFMRSAWGERECHHGVKISVPNANLIKASPDLYAALEETLASCERLSGVSRDDDVDETSIIGKARAVLKMARGESD